MSTHNCPSGQTPVSGNGGRIPSEMGIRKRIVVLLLLLFVPLLLLESFTYYKWFQERKKVEMQANLEIARTVAKTFDAFIQDVLHTQLAIGMAATASPAPSAASLLHMLREAERVNPALRSFAWAGPDGVNLVTTNPRIANRKIAIEDQFLRILSGEEWRVTDIYPSPYTGEQVFMVLRGIRDQKGAFLGMVTAIVVADKLDRLLAVQRSKGAGISLVDSRGIHVYRSPTARFTAVRWDWLKSYPVIADALRGKEVVATVVSGLSGTRRLIAFAPVPSIGWVAAASLAETVMIGAIIGTLLPQAILILLVAIAAFGAAIAFSRPISASIVKLRNYALALGRGEVRDLTMATGPGELKDLADAFNDMAGKVRLREEELREARDDLERRVEERTEELRKAYEKLKEEAEERQHMEEQLRQSHKLEAVGTLAGGIAHDFNNMLAVVLGNAELALDDLEDNDEARHYIDQIVKASKRARDLVRQILTFSRKSEHGKDPLILTALIKETYELLRASLPSTIHMELDVRAGFDTIMGDPSQIQQVLMNLATNAAYAMEERGGTLSIGLSNSTFTRLDRMPGPDMEPGTYVQLCVGDTGTGISGDVQKRMFEPFFTTKKPGEGTGMGLAVVYGIVKNHKGVISVESKADVGSTFTIFLPCAETAQRERPEQAGAAPGGRERILLVDDEPAVVEMASRTLRRLGYDVVADTSGSRALGTFLEDPRRFDLVITDQMMPGLTGIDLAQRMLEVRKDLPIILITGYSETVSPEQATSAGISELVMKPLAKEEMAETVRRVLDGRTGNR